MTDKQYDSYTILKMIIYSFNKEKSQNFLSRCDIFKGIVQILTKQFNKKYQLRNQIAGCFIISLDDDEIFLTQGDFDELLKFYKSETMLNKIELLLN